jgi:hypothetical protein
MASEKITAMPNWGGAQVPTDLLTGVDLSAALANQNVKTTLDDMFSTITKNVTDVSLQFQDGVAAAVSAAGNGKLIYNDTAKSFQVSEDAGAYQNLLKGTGLNQQVTYWTAADVVAGDTEFVYDATNKRVGIGVTVAASVSPLNVRADSGAVAQTWFPNTVSDTPRLQAQVASSDAFIGTSTLHRFHLLTNNLARLTVDTAGAVGINQQVPTAQLHVVPGAIGTVGFLVNGAAGQTANLANFQNNNNARFQFTAAGELIIGNASVTDGKVTLLSAGAAFTQSLMAGTVPAATNAFRWPNANPTAGQILSASAPAAGIVTLTWITPAGGTTTPGTPVQSVQFNAPLGTFAGNAAFLYDPTTSPNLNLVGAAAAHRAFLFKGAVAGQTVAIGQIESSDGNQFIRFDPALQEGNSLHIRNNDVASTFAQGVDVVNTATATYSFIRLGQDDLQKFASLVYNSSATANTDLTNVPSAGFFRTGNDATNGLIFLVQANAPIIFGANGTAFASEIGRFIPGTSGVLRLGVPSSVDAKLQLAVAGSANTTSLQGAVTPSASLTYRFPATPPTANQILASSAPSAGVCTLSWVTDIGPNAPNFSVQINGGAGLFDSNGQFTYDTGTNTVLIGSGSALGALKFRDTTVANGITLKVSAPDGNNVWTLPNTQATLNQVLTATAVSGVNVTLGWTTPAAATTPAAPTNSVQYNNAGAFGGNAGLLYIPGSTTGDELALASSTITSGNLFSIAMTGTAAASNTKTGLKITSSGANGTASQTVFGQTVSVTNTGTTNTNIALQLTASGAATTNAALKVTAGIALFDNGSSSAPSIAFNAVPGNGFHVIDGNTFSWDTGGTRRGTFSTNDLILFSTAGQFEINSDVGLARAAAAVWRTTNASTGIGSLLVAASTASVTGNFSVISSNAATATVYDVARLGANSTGTAAAGFGGTFSRGLQSSTTADQTAIQEKWFWQNATHATRSAAVSWTVVNNATLTEYMNLSPAGGGGTFVATAACLSVYAGTAPSVWTAGAFACKLYLIDAAGTPATGCAANFSTTAIASPAWMMLRGRGTNASPAAVQSGDQLGELQYCGQYSTSTNNFAYGALIRVTATETWTVSATGCDMFFHTSVTGGTVAEKMSLRNTGTLRINATSGTFNTTTLLQVGNYASWNTDAVGAIYTAANGTKGLEIIGTSGQTADLFRVFRDTVTPDLFKVQSVLGTVVRAGLGVNAADYAYVGGNLKTNTASANNVSTTETDLITYSLRASSLGTNGDYVVVDAWGTFSSTASNKRVRMYFGGTAIFDTTALAFANSSWRIRAKIFRTGAATQISIASFDGNFVLLTDNAATAAPAETLSGAVTIKCTGQDSVGSDNITQLGLNVNWYPNGQ